MPSAKADDSAATTAEDAATRTERRLRAERDVLAQFAVEVGDGVADRLRQVGDAAADSWRRRCDIDAIRTLLGRLLAAAAPPPPPPPPHPPARTASVGLADELNELSKDLRRETYRVFADGQLADEELTRSRATADEQRREMTRLRDERRADGALVADLREQLRSSEERLRGARATVAREAEMHVQRLAEHERLWEVTWQRMQTELEQYASANKMNQERLDGLKRQSDTFARALSERSCTERQLQATVDEQIDQRTRELNRMQAEMHTLQRRVEEGRATCKSVQEALEQSNDRELRLSEQLRTTETALSTAHEQSRIAKREILRMANLVDAEEAKAQSRKDEVAKLRRRCDELNRQAQTRRAVRSSAATDEQLLRNASDASSDAAWMLTQLGYRRRWPAVDRMVEEASSVALAAAELVQKAQSGASPALAPHKARTPPASSPPQRGRPTLVCTTTYECQSAAH